MITAGVSRFDQLPFPFPFPFEVEQRFWAKVEILSNGCWMWRGALNRRGYGQFGVKVDGYTVRGFRVHRLVFAMAWGDPLPPGMVIDHLCHDPKLCCGGDDCPHRRCVNPAHMTLTTDSVNNSGDRHG